MDKLIYTVIMMRNAQKEFFQIKNKRTLQAAIRWEMQVDALLKNCKVAIMQKHIEGWKQSSLIYEETMDGLRMKE